MSNPREQEPELPRPQGYVSEKLSILMGAIRSALRRFGFVLRDDAVQLPAAAGSRPAAPSATASAPAGEDVAAAAGARDQLDVLASPTKLPGLATVGHGLQERVLHDAAESSDSRAVRIAHEALEEERLQRRLVA